jgi:hypothetical protein
MKNAILISLLFSGITNFAADRNQTTKANAELLCSWQYKTSYMSDGKMCYFTTDNYYFYTDNSCVKVTTTNECNAGASKELIEYSRWLKTENNLVLLNKSGKQIASFAAKNNSADLLKGQKVIVQTIILPKQILIPSNDDQLAMNQ